MDSPVIDRSSGQRVLAIVGLSLNEGDDPDTICTHSELLLDYFHAKEQLSSGIVGG